MPELDGVALVTGAASGIGRAAALRLAEAGADVALVDMNDAGLLETRVAVESHGRRAITIIADVTSEDDTRAMVAKAFEGLGRVDYAVNSAGVGGGGHGWGSTSVAAWDRIVDINLKGVWLSMTAELDLMRAQGCGAVVNLASIYGLAGAAQSAAYTASKHGVVGLTKSAALEYAKDGIRVNAVCPAHVETPMTMASFERDPNHRDDVLSGIPFRRLGTVAEMADAIVWLASDAASFVTGHALQVDGGFGAR